MNIYGPGGETPELGIEALVENIYKLAGWHEETVIGIPMIDEFKQQLAARGMR